MNNSRWLTLAALLGCIFLAVFATSPRAEDATANAEPNAQSTLGLVKEKPKSGRFVETEQGYMVPYTAKIPGTDVEFIMQPIPGGKFKLGSPESEADRSDDEGPQVEIEVAPYWIAQHEVTWAEYKVFMGIYEPLKSIQAMRSLWQTKNQKPDVLKKQKELKKVAEEMPNLKPLLESDVADVDAITVPTPLYEPPITFESGEDPRQPAVTMSQYAAKQYTKWMSLMTAANYRLPTEAEWEYACRAGTTTAYHFGDDPDMIEDFGWYTDNSDGKTQKVELKKPNPWNLYDMHGNVSEWVIDGYAETGYDHLKDTAKTYTAAEAIRKTEELFPRALRGGHWDDDPDRCRSAARLASDDYEWYDTDPNIPKSPWWFTDFPAGGVGFRMVRPLAAMSDKEKKLFWEADVEFLIEDVTNRLGEGRGVKENVGPTLPDSISEAKEVDQKVKID